MAGADTRGSWLLEENAGRRLKLRFGKMGQQGFYQEIFHELIGRKAVGGENWRRTTACDCKCSV